MGLQKRLVAARKSGAVEDVHLLCEHPHVITWAATENAGISGFGQVLRQRVLSRSSDRGGGHYVYGPGQLVGYPIYFGRDPQRRGLVRAHAGKVMIRATTNLDAPSA